MDIAELGIEYFTNFYISTILCLGIVWNIKGTIPPGSLGSMINAILKIFSESLAIDAGETVIRMKEAEKNRLKLAVERETEENMSDVTENCVLSEDYDLEEIPKGKVKKGENDISDFLPVSVSAWLLDSLVCLAGHLTGLDSVLARANYLWVLLILAPK